MNTEDLVRLGSNTAKAGFQNEDDIVLKFNTWEKDKDAQLWLCIMGYNIKEIDFVKAIKISGKKTDVQVQVNVKLKDSIDVQNLQVKLVSNLRGFNQIDKRWVDNYIPLWEMPSNIISILKRYTGEIPPKHNHNGRDSRRTFGDEFTPYEIKEIIDWLNHKKTLIVADILKGRGQFSAEWMLVAQKIDMNSRWILKPMNVCINYFGSGKIIISPRGTFKIGKITMQRKGGDGGRPTANMLQFKINPS